MKTFKLYGVLFEVLVLLASSSVAVNQLQFNNGNFNVSWNYSSASQEIEFEIRAKTTGYVALGLTKVNSDMKGLDIVLVGVNSGVKTIKDLNANSESTPSEDPQQNYMLISASESNGITMARCKRKLLTNDNDLPIKPGEKVYIAWATNTGNDALSYHSNRGYSSEMQELVPIEASPTTGSSSNGTVASETTATTPASETTATTPGSATMATGSALPLFVLAVFAALLAP